MPLGAARLSEERVRRGAEATCSHLMRGFVVCYTDAQKRFVLPLQFVLPLHQDQETFHAT